MTVVNGNAMTPSFTVGNGDVLKTQFVAKIGNDYYYRVYAIGTPGQSTGVYTTLPGQNASKALHSNDWLSVSLVLPLWSGKQPLCGLLS